MKKALVIIVILLMGISIFAVTAEEAIANYKKNNAEYLQTLNKDIEILMSKTANEVTKIFNDKKIFPGYFAAIKEKYSFIETIYLAKNNNEFILCPDQVFPDGYKPTERSWYKNAVKTPDKVTRGEIYLNANTETYLISYAKAIIINSKIAGVIGIDVELKK